jgi:Reverse transcriptase (RNA-dependent DNA polymerase)
MASDPVYLHRLGHILPRLYYGGYSAVVDAAKFFYQFPTRPEERPYMGLRHPITTHTYWYCGLPMGSANSPALASRFGNAFVRQLRAAHPYVFGNRLIVNTWAQGASYQPELGYGYVWVTPDGRPGVQIYVFVDDFLLHGPTYSLTCQGLSLFMDEAVRVGLLCHPKKLIPPQQRVRYCGFELDTQTVPSIQLPEDKRCRIEAMIQYVITRHLHIPGLAVAVITGVLEAIIEATPSRYGSHYIRALYDTLGILPGDSHLPPQYARYYQMVCLSSEALSELCWWKTLLEKPVIRKAYVQRTNVVTSLFGDGSGTGAGGTITFGAPSQTITWMGAWTSSNDRSSNWRELRTVLASLQHIYGLPEVRARIAGSTVLYFTDNMVTYYVCYSNRSRSPALHQLIMAIRELESVLQVALEVIHIPGIVLIAQGTDGLSRGIWATPHNTPYVGRDWIYKILSPVQRSPDLQHTLHALSNFPWQWHTIDHLSVDVVLHHATVWCPSPETTQQCLSTLLTWWTESPLDTSCAVFTPRILQKWWSSVSRYLSYYTLETSVTDLGIPIVLIILNTHTRALSPHRMDTSTKPTTFAWYQKQVEELRGLSM